MLDTAVAEPTTTGMGTDKTMEHDNTTERTTKSAPGSETSVTEVENIATLATGIRDGTSNTSIVGGTVGGIGLLILLVVIICLALFLFKRRLLNFDKRNSMHDPGQSLYYIIM